MKAPMFQPLTEAEVAAGQGGHQQRDADEWQPIIPPPEIAPATFRHGQLGEAIQRFPYHNADGELEGYQCRFNFVGEDGEPDKTFRPRRYGTLNGKTGWHWKGWEAGRPLYRLPAILANPDKPILVVEGEGKADAAQAMFPDYVCTAPMNGANSPHLTNYSPCESRSVRVMGDNDAAGHIFADAVARHSQGAGAASVAIVEVPEGFPPKWDFANKLPERWDVPRLHGLLEAARPWKGNEPDAAPAGDEAEERSKPRLLIENCDPHRTVAVLRDILSKAGDLYDRGVPVRLAFDKIQGGAIAQVMTPDILVLMAHMVSRPYVLIEQKDGTVVEKDARLSRTYAVMYLDWRGEWQLRPLNGIASAPLLEDDGAIHSAQGYDQASGMWRENVPDVAGLVPEQPTLDDASTALRLIRETFKTFCFADAETVHDAAWDLDLVDTSKHPGKDESGFLAALLTAVCRPSLHLAPGVLFRAAPMSGAGAGKGLLAHCISIIAFGREPHAVTSGANAEELEKRIAAELMEGSPVLFLDNLNNKAFKSDLLASAITERPARVRVLGRSQMVPLNATAFVILTGNGLSVSEDLARRFIAVEFDARTEDPEARKFPTDIHAEVTERRTELLAALLTIWRWGRLAKGMKTGRALGSFEQWCMWVRDPLIALGCKDPADRVSEAKERDSRRQVIAELFSVWWKKHQDQAIAIRDLAYEVRQVADPQDRGRQYLSSRLEKLDGTRVAGFVLTRQAATGKWGAATYALENTAGPDRHRGHRGHGTGKPPKTRPEAPDAGGAVCTNSNDAGPDYGPKAPMPPMPPMPSTTPQQSESAETDGPRWRKKI